MLLENFVLGTWQHVMSSQTSILKSFVLYWTSSLPGFTGRGRLLLVKWRRRSRWMFYHLATMLVWWECFAHLLWRARLEQHLLHHAVLLSEILKCFLDRCLNSQSFSWTVDSRTSRNGQNWSKKEFSGDNARWIVMDIELLDNYILCEYFSIVEKRSYVLAHFLIWEKISLFPCSIFVHRIILLSNKFYWQVP